MQCPGDVGSAQLRQPPTQALSQQTPSTQKPDWHSLALLQRWPSRFGPQLRLTHAMPSSQSASVAQLVAHAAVAQRNGWQSWIPAAPHTPRPSQVAGVFSLFPAQLATLHGVSRGNLAQPPRPSQSPV